MELLGRVCTLIAFVCAVNSLEKARYDNYRVYQISIDDENQLQLMKEIENFPDGYRFTSALQVRLGSRTELIVPPHKFGEFSELVEKFSMKVKIVTMNLQKSIEKELLQSKRRKTTLDWTSYWTLDEVNEWLDSLIIKYPSSVSSFKVGTSYEGREIRGVKVNMNNVANKKSIFIEATIHSNEWIATATSTYILNELLTSDDLEVQQIAERYEWYFLPVFNVDGYVFTWTTDRLWRKTRRPNKNLLCKGADANRNFNIRFNEFSSSQNPCSPIYAGDFVFSETESQELASFMATVPKLVGYFSFHCLGQQLMFPHGYTTEPIEKFEILNEIAIKAGAALTAKHGKVYDVGPITEFFGLVSGTSFDWVIDTFKPNVTFLYELRPTRDVFIDGAEVGQLLPADQILETGNEVFASFITILKEAFIQGIA